MSGRLCRILRSGPMYGPGGGFVEVVFTNQEKTAMPTFNRIIARLLILCTFALGMPLPASAAIVGTDQLTANAERNKVLNFLDRADVQVQLEARGISATEAKARVSALTDDQVKQLAGRIDQLPAGGDGIIGALVLIFVILLITDILGLTKVFPFTRSVR